MSTTTLTQKPRIAVAGAGVLGLRVVQALLEASYPVTILTRSAGQNKAGIPADADVRYTVVYYSSIDSLRLALQGHFGVVSTVHSVAVDEQSLLVDAALDAGVSRFIPSEFGSDRTNPKASLLPLCAPKIALEQNLQRVAAVNPRFSYTAISNGPFLDWCLDANFLFDLKNRSATLCDGGNNKISMTTLAGVAKAVVAVFEHLEETKNRYIRIHEAVLSYNDIIELSKRRDPTDWKLQHAQTEDVLARAKATLLKGNPEEIYRAMVDMLLVVVNNSEYGADLTGKTENELLGLPMLTEKELEELVSKYM